MVLYLPFSTAYTPEPTRCSSGATPGARALQSWACDESPWGEHLWDVGIFACRDVFGGWCPDCDRDNLSQHASGGALDSAHNIVAGGNPHAKAFALWEVANHAVLGVQEVITNRRRWTKATGWRDYHGASPHIDHVHSALNASGRRYLTRARILSVAPKPPAPPEPEDDMPKQWLVRIGAKTLNVCQVDAARGGVSWLQGAEAIRGAQLSLRVDTGDSKAGAVCRLDPGAADKNLADMARYVLGLPFYGPMPPGHVALRAKYGVTGPHITGSP